MSWDDDFSREMEELDEYEYVNKLGIYAEDEPDEDPNDELQLSGLDPDELEDMDEDRRNRVIEDAGLDPDDYNFYGTSSGRTTHSVGTAMPYSRSSQTYQRSSTNRPTQPVRSSASNGKWSLGTFIGVMTAVTIIGFLVAALGGQLIGAIVVIVIGLIILFGL